MTNEPSPPTFDGIPIQDIETTQIGTPEPAASPAFNPAPWVILGVGIALFLVFVAVTLRHKAAPE